MDTPLYHHLNTLAASRPLRLDMPGHHGHPLPGGLIWPAHLDFTENGATGDLFGCEDDAIAQSELLWASRFGFDCCLFLTGGSTQGIHTGLALLAGAGEEILLDRGSHRAVYNALGLLDLYPRFLQRPWMEQGVAGPICPKEVEQSLSTNPELKTVCITSPTYYGILSDIPAIAQVCHAHQARLMVDGAHGAHLPFLGYRGYAAADLVVMSAHKTLPAPGQTALLFANGLTLDQLRRWGSVYGSSSPSYVMMAALDVLRDYMEQEGAARYQAAVRLTHQLRQAWPALTPDPLELDPTRLTLCCPDGFALANHLRIQGIYPELADQNHIVFILTCADGEETHLRLSTALKDANLSASPPILCAPPSSLPEIVLTPRQAMFAPTEQVPLHCSEGRVAACQLAPYPPGVPVIAPGERIQKKYLAYFNKIGYNKDTVEVVRFDAFSRRGFFQ